MNINVLASRLASKWASWGWPSITEVGDKLAAEVGVVDGKWAGWTCLLSDRSLIATRGIERVEIDVGPQPLPVQLEAERVLGGIIAKHPIRIAYSGGKDSSAVLSLTLRAAALRKAAGEKVCPIVITAADTGVESPEVVALRAQFLAAATDYAEHHGLDVRVVVTRPNIAEAWWPRILAGRKLPSAAGVKSDCSVDLKIKPMLRAANRIRRELEAEGWGRLVTVLGTRFDESARRAAKMAERGDSASAIVEREGELFLSPIANWSSANVFDYMLSSRAPKIPAPWDALQAFYADSSSECVIVPDTAVDNTAKCGARSGCFVCQQVTADHGAERLIEKPDYAYLEPLVRLNRYLSATMWDLGKRHWIRQALVGGHAAIGPNCFSFEHTDELMRILLTLDVEEVERAERCRRDLEAGNIPDSPRNRRLAQPQFCNLPFTDVVAIDFMRSVDGFGPEHAALQAWDDVWRNGQRFPIPDVPASPRGAVPDTRYVRVFDSPLAGAGLCDPVAEALGAERRRAEDWVTGQWAWAGEAEDATFVVDQEAAWLFYAFELDAAVARGPALRACEAARFYLRLGTVEIPRGASARIDSMFRRTAAKIAAGLAWNTDVSAISASAEMQEVECEDQKEEEVGPSSDVLFGKQVALELALADGAIDEHQGTTLLRRVSAALRRAERDQPLSEFDKRRRRQRLIEVRRDFLADKGFSACPDLVLGFLPVGLLPPRRFEPQLTLFG